MSTQSSCGGIWMTVTSSHTGRYVKINNGVAGGSHYNGTTHLHAHVTDSRMNPVVSGGSSPESSGSNRRGSWPDHAHSMNTLDISPAQSTSCAHSPEVYLGRQYSSACDIFSMGLCVYVVITENEDPYGTEGASVEAKVAFDPNFRPSVDVDTLTSGSIGWLIPLLSRMWHSDPENRPSIVELAETFSKHLKNKGEAEDGTSDEDVDSVVRPKHQELPGPAHVATHAPGGAGVAHEDRPIRQKQGGRLEKEDELTPELYSRLLQKIQELENSRSAFEADSESC